jgi:L-threonylcarbamoyladenylate synthase
MRRVFVDRGAPQRDAIQEAVTWILKGGVVALPTDTLYGLAVDPFNRTAVARVFEVKGRKEDRAMPLIAADLDQVVMSLGSLSPIARHLASRYWPGPLTLVMPAPAAMPRTVTGGRSTVGVRVPADEIARAVCAGCKGLVTATSANISGETATAEPDEVERTLGSRIDFLLDTGPTPGGPASTIIDVTSAQPALIRAGAISWEDIRVWLSTDPRAGRV